MTEDWREGYRGAMLMLMGQRGRVVREGRSWRSYSVWQDYGATDELQAHMAACTPAVESSSGYRESEWQEFDGTFADPPWGQHHGVDVHLTCVCGLIEGRHVRLEATIGQIIAWLLESDQ